MAKIYGLFGSMTGKLADTVMAVRNGEQLARKYQPVVYNPSTPAQIAQRAKMKLMSQLSAVMAPVIAIRRQGPVSSRNLFTKANFRHTTFSNDTADVTLTDITLTNSIVGFSPVNATISNNNLTAALTSVLSDINRVVYAAFMKMPDNTLRYVGSTVVTAAGAQGDWPGTISNVSGNVVVYAYGVRDNTEAARVIFGNLQALSAETVAKVVTSRTLTESDITLTETTAAEAQSSREEPDQDPEKKSGKAK